jgi:hypothetical protein
VKLEVVYWHSSPLHSTRLDLSLAMIAMWSRWCKDDEQLPERDSGGRRALGRAFNILGQVKIRRAVQFQQARQAG